MGITLFPAGAQGSVGGETDYKRLAERTGEIQIAVRDLVRDLASAGTTQLVLKN